MGEVEYAHIALVGHFAQPVPRNAAEAATSHAIVTGSHMTATRSSVSEST